MHFALYLSLFLLPVIGSDGSVRHWVDAAYRFVRQMNCDENMITSSTECENLLKRPRSSFTVHVAEATAAAKLIAVLPDGPVDKGSKHDIVVVLDPYPMASFGHLVIVLFIDKGVHHCEGTLISHNECLTFAIKSRCHNLLDRKSRRRPDFGHRCQINFMPLVHLETELTPPFQQRLLCQKNISGFFPCPILRHHNETSTIICNPLDVNTQRCATTHESVHTRCRLMERCDQAVLLAGGWNRDHSLPSFYPTLHSVFHLLRDNGFHNNNIKVFYANGASSKQVVGDNHHVLYPSAMKLAMRYHLRKLCSSPHCVNSLFIYLNSPTKNDGTMLLWDIDRNGETDETEIYTVKELFADLKACIAQQVILLVDQSFSWEVIKAFSHSEHNSNVIILANGKEGQYSWNKEFTKHWINATHTHSCLTDIHQAAKKSLRHSTATFYDSSNGRMRTTLAGAPCNVTPPFTHQELRQKYWGCQNLPTKEWFSPVSYLFSSEDK